ncbi:unnamed protein product, partial [Bubo scandiacus]
QRAAGRGDTGNWFEQSRTSRTFITNLKAIILSKLLYSKIILKYVKKAQREKTSHFEEE